MLREESISFETFKGVTEVGTVAGVFASHMLFGLELKDWRWKEKRGKIGQQRKEKISKESIQWNIEPIHIFCFLSESQKRACEFLLSKQKEDGGWGETFAVSSLFILSSSFISTN